MVTVPPARSMETTFGARPVALATWGALRTVPSGSSMNGL
jgi:hypothetical protein